MHDQLMHDESSKAASRTEINQKESDGIFRYSYFEAALHELTNQFADAEPFPHIVLDGFLQADWAEALIAEYPPLDDDAWFHYSHYNEKTRSLNERCRLGSKTQQVVDALQSERFLAWLSQLTGFRNLLADRELEAGGLQVALSGGFLNIHADFTVHPHHRSWARRCNLLLYLNKDWPDSYGGHLELWDRQMTRRVQRISPVFNRCVIFTTDFTSFHGYPDPISCPRTTARRTLSLYYYTHENQAPPIQTTEYRARPEDTLLTAAWIWLDKKGLWGYDFLKRHLGIGDSLGSALMKITEKLRRK
jgi:Rps23 Pro-64 3,4-dihydroxylase Tpa1-like proline 4-hydroxylase